MCGIGRADAIGIGAFDEHTVFGTVPLLAVWRCTFKRGIVPSSTEEAEHAPDTTIDICIEFERVEHGGRVCGIGGGFDEKKFRRCAC